MKFTNLSQEEIPRWYGLSWVQEDPSIVVSIPKGYFLAIEEEVLSWALPYAGTLGIGEFVRAKNGPYGFNGRLSITEAGEHILIKAPVPQVMHVLDEPCSYCEGTGEDEFLRRECMYCHGLKKEHQHDFSGAYAVSATLNALFSAMFSAPEESKNQIPQLMRVDLVTRSDHYGGAISGTFAIPLVKWLSSMEKGTEIREIVEAMKVAYKKMYGERFFHLFEHSFSAWINLEGGRLIMMCPGDACEIHPDDYSSPSEEGYEFSCHNVDSPAQQIALLSGLAILHDLADRNLYDSNVP